jgi:predicted SnoaL-like aldol condensation-catalyzing enzyme
MNKLTLVVFVMLTIISCNNQKEKSMSSTQNEKLIQTYFEHFNNHDWVKMADMYVEIPEFKDPSLGKGIVKQTKKEIVAKYAELNKIFPDLHDTIIQMYPSGNNHVIVEFVSTGTAPDNSKFELPICTIFTIEKGKITKDFTYFDNFEEEK